MTQHLPSPCDLLTEEDVATLLSVKPRTVRLWRSKAGLPHLKLTAKVVRVRRSDLDRWLDQHRLAISA